MKYKEFKKMYIGKSATINVLGMKVKVIIKGAKRSYGHDRFKVQPVSGSGMVWVQDIKIKK